MTFTEYNFEKHGNTMTTEDDVLGVFTNDDRHKQSMVDIALENSPTECINTDTPSTMFMLGLIGGYIK